MKITYHGKPKQLKEEKRGTKSCFYDQLIVLIGCEESIRENIKVEDYFLIGPIFKRQEVEERVMYMSITFQCTVLPDSGKYGQTSIVEINLSG